MHEDMGDDDDTDSAEGSEYEGDSETEELQVEEEYIAVIDEDTRLEASQDSEEYVGESLSCAGSVSPAAMGRKVVGSGEDGASMETQCGQ